MRVVWPEGTAAVCFCFVCFFKSFLFFFLNLYLLKPASRLLCVYFLILSWWNQERGFTLDMFYVCACVCVCLCVLALCGGQQPGSSAVYPVLCSLRRVERAPTAVLLMRLADYCGPSPLPTSAPPPQWLIQARPDWAGPVNTRTQTPHTLTYTHKHTQTRAQTHAHAFKYLGLCSFILLGARI